VFPALAVAQHLTGRYDVHVLVDERGKGYLKMDDPFTVHVMDTRPYGGGSLRQTIKGCITLMGDVARALSLIRRIQPRFVISFGSYVSVAPLIAARLLGIETLAHEQNAVMGRANRLACLVARRVALTFPETQGISRRLKKKTLVTGMPLRQAFLEPLVLRDEARPHGSVNVLVMGGSLGARQLGRLVPEAVELMAAMSGRGYDSRERPLQRPWCSFRSLPLFQRCTRSNHQSRYYHFPLGRGEFGGNLLYRPCMHFGSVPLRHARSSKEKRGVFWGS
jgi:UDP-N-acetylglucosamine:LPS N-acetylglucosamine transferase